MSPGSPIARERQTSTTTHQTYVTSQDTYLTLLPNKTIKIKQRPQIFKACCLYLVWPCNKVKLAGTLWQHVMRDVMSVRGLTVSLVPWGSLVNNSLWSPNNSCAIFWDSLVTPAVPKTLVFAQLKRQEFSQRYGSDLPTSFTYMYV